MKIMKKNYFLTILSLLFCIAIQAQVIYSGNGNTGFGDVFGSTGSIQINDNGTTLTFKLNKGAGSLNDDMVIYIDSKTGGFSDTSTFNDTADDLRKAISGYDGFNRSTVNFPAGFTADYAIGIDVANSNFGGLWTLVSSGSHTFIESVNISPNNNTSSTNYTFDINFTEIGITATDNFKFVVTYLNSSSAYRSDEAIGEGLSSGNQGAATVTFTGDKSYPNTWTGTTDTDWATATNWTEGTPSTTDNVYIPAVTNHPTAAAAVTINKGIIKSGATLRASGAFTGTITYERNLAVVDKWYLVSSPVSGETIEDLISNHTFATGTDSNIGIAPYVNDGTAWSYQTAASTGALNAGQGYSVRLATAGNISFTGTMPVADVGIAITTNTNGFNLVGNPYPSFIAVNNNADATNNILKVNDTDNDYLTESTIWLWNQATTSYDLINQTGNTHIAPGQGFFVSSNGSHTFSITEAMQSHQGTDTFQRTVNTRPEINLMMTDGSSTRDTDIFYIDGKTTGFDNGYDSSIFGGVSHSFAVYTEAVANSNGKRLGIQSLPNSDLESMVIPVGVIADAVEITFSAEAINLPEGIKVFLEDRTTNTFTRLDEANSEYTVTLSAAANGIGRFYLHTTQSVLSIDTNAVLDNVSVYKTDNSTLRIVGLQQGNASIKLFNILGKQVMNSSFKTNGVQNISLPQLATGIYIVQLTTETGKLNKKIVLE